MAHRSPQTTAPPVRFQGASLCCPVSNLLDIEQQGLCCWGVSKFDVAFVVLTEVSWNWIRSFSTGHPAAAFHAICFLGRNWVLLSSDEQHHSLASTRPFLRIRAVTRCCAQLCTENVTAMTSKILPIACQVVSGRLLPHPAPVLAKALCIYATPSAMPPMVCLTWHQLTSMAGGSSKCSARSLPSC